MKAPASLPTASTKAHEESNSRAWMLVLLIMAPFAIQAASYAKLLLQYIFVRNDTGYPEGACVYAFVTAARTGHLYTDPFQLPFNVQLYGPIFYVIGFLLAKAAHGDLLLTAELARGVSLLSFFGSAGLAGYLAWRLERRMRWAVAAGVLGVACTWAIPYVASARPESLSFLFIFAAITVYEISHGRSRLLIWVGVLGSLSLLVKQSTAPVLFALLVDALLARRFRNAASLIAGSLPVPLIVYSVMRFRHEPFLANFSAIGHARLDWPSVPRTVLDLFRVNQAAIVPILIAVLGAAVSWKKERYRAIVLAAGFACVSSVAALSNLGGAGHYLILPWLMVMPMIPAGMMEMEKWARRNSLIPVGTALVGLLLLVHQRNLLTQTPPRSVDTSSVANLKMLSDSQYLEMNSREPQLLDPYFYHDMELQKVWSFAPIGGEIAREEFDLVLINGQDGKAASDFVVGGFRGISYWGTDAMAAIENHYRVACEAPHYLAFVPRDRNGTVDSDEVERIFGEPCRETIRLPQLAPGLLK